MNTITRICVECNQPFEAIPSEIKRGNAKFCSKTCFSKNRSKSMTKLKIPNAECATCHKQLYRTRYQIKSSKSGLFFCSAKCRNEAQKLHSPINFSLSHYTDGKWIHYRNILPNATEIVCPLCNRLLPIKAIDVHHKDGNRNNNDPNNLLVCCPTCHRLEHLKMGEP